MVIQLAVNNQRMGQIIENIHSLTPKQSSSKEIPLCMEKYVQISALENGNIIMKAEDNSLCYLYHKELQNSTTKQDYLYDWMNAIYNHSCNVLSYEVKERTLLCGSHVNIKVLLEYGEKNLFQILNQCYSVRESCSYNESIKFDTPLELLSFIKLMINVVEEQREKNKLWVGFHTKSIVYFNKSKSFKYFFLYNFEESNYNEEFFAPETASEKEISEKDTVFSMGMVLLSLFLKEDCSDCYNYQNHTFCESIFQEKLEKMKEKMITKGLLGILDDESQYISQFDEEVSEFISLMTEKELERLSFAEVKKKYLWLIRKASFSFGVHNQMSSRSVLQPLTTKRMDRNKRKIRMQTNIGCFQNKEDVHFKTTFTEIDQSDLFTISRSNIQSKNEKKIKDNQTLKWKKAITKKMKEQKENLPFYDQD